VGTEEAKAGWPSENSISKIEAKIDKLNRVTHTGDVPVAHNSAKRASTKRSKKSEEASSEPESNTRLGPTSERPSVSATIEDDPILEAANRARHLIEETLADKKEDE
jgi:hypothetical protein